MPRRRALLLSLLLPAANLTAATLSAQETTDVPAVLPKAVVDLRTVEGVRLVNATWRYSDVAIVPAEHRDAGTDLRASGAPNRTSDITPHAGAADFDDSQWTVVQPQDLEGRRSAGRLAFAWYRTSVTLPGRIAGFPVKGSTVVLELVLDDYAEIWVDGRLPVALGQTGGQLVKGFNAPNRVVLTTDARPGQTFRLAVFGANAPLSDPPANFIWIRSATLDFYPPGVLGRTPVPGGRIVRLDPSLDRVVPPGATIDKLAAGFQFTEGPVWHPDGYLLFSDPNANTIYRWSPEGAVSVYRTKSGYSGPDIGAYRQPGSNGLTLDGRGLLTINEHGNRRVVRLERPGNITVLADRYQGKRLNSPNDLVYHSDGSLYFTDPPFGLPATFEDPKRELSFSGVYRLRDGQLTLLTAELSGPNGIALSPDERYLYVGNWDLRRKVLMRYELTADGTLANGRVFRDFTAELEEVALDGVKVDQAGNVYVSAPRGVWILSPDGEALGRIELPEHAANMAWGDADGRTLYLTATTGLYRLRLGVPGVRPPAAVRAASR
jgi:gluconolactonase